MEIQRTLSEHVLQVPFAILDAAVERHTRGWHVWRIVVTRAQLTAGSTTYALSNHALGHFGDITVWAGGDGKQSTWQASSIRTVPESGQAGVNDQREKQMATVAGVLVERLRRDDMSEADITPTAAAALTRPTSRDRNEWFAYKRAAGAKFTYGQLAAEIDPPGLSARAVGAAYRRWLKATK